MRIRWNNVVGLSLAICGLIIGINMSHCIETFFDTIKYPHQVHYDPGQDIMGLFGLIIIVLSIVAIIKVFFGSGR